MTSGKKKNPGETSRLLHAIRFAAEQHRDHRRKGKTAAPYINHPIAVAEQLARAGHEDNTDLLMAAVLHDVVEDTETEAEDLEALFGPKVTQFVMEVSDDKSLEAYERKKLVVRNIAEKSPEAQLIKLSDIVANVYDVIHHPPNWDDQRKGWYFDWCENVVDKIRGTHKDLEAQFDELILEARKGL